MCEVHEYTIVDIVVWPSKFSVPGGTHHQATNDSNQVAGSIQTPVLNFSATAFFPLYCLINTFSRAEMSRYTTRNRKRI